MGFQSQLRSRPLRITATTYRFQWRRKVKKYGRGTLGHTIHRCFLLIYWYKNGQGARASPFHPSSLVPPALGSDYYFVQGRPMTWLYLRKLFHIASIYIKLPMNDSNHFPDPFIHSKIGMTFFFQFFFQSVSSIRTKHLELNSWQLFLPLQCVIISE